MALLSRDEHSTILNQLREMVGEEHTADATQILTRLSENFNETETALNSANENVEKFKGDNEKLRAVNADLFLKVGGAKVEDNNPNKTDEEKLPFDALFNEKGELI